MSSRPEHPRHSTGAHRSRGDDRRLSRSRPAERPDPGAAGDHDDGYEPYLDGLFTYCLSVLCDHDAATAVLGEVLALAERHHTRCPADPARHRSWFYALARWACLRRLAERAGQDAGRPDGKRAAAGRAVRDAERRQRELAALAWPARSASRRRQAQRARA
ncbi:sigma-70 family RNA polymerase sigma factor, partial [Streptomyces lydicus]